MEGYLLKKGAGESTFGRRTWKKRWFVLDSYEMSYYEDFDNELGRPVNEKGVYNVKGCTVKKFDDAERKFMFTLTGPDKKQPVQLQALDERTLAMWIKAIEAASEGNFGRVVIDYTPFYNILGLSKDSEISASDINRAYRKLALKMHPDKGGDIHEFKKLQEASNTLLNKLEEEEKEKLYETQYIDAYIVKGPPGVGFGMVVVEDTKRGAVSVKSVMPTMQLVRIHPNPDDHIKPGDHLEMIGADDVSNWAMGRIVQRLSDFRVPVGTEIQLRFSRRVRIDGLEDEPAAPANDDYQPAPMPAHVPMPPSDDDVPARDEPMQNNDRRKSMSRTMNDSETSNNRRQSVNNDGWNERDRSSYRSEGNHTRREDIDESEEDERDRNRGRGANEIPGNRRSSVNKMTSSDEDREPQPNRRASSYDNRRDFNQRPIPEERGGRYPKNHDPQDSEEESDGQDYDDDIDEEVRRDFQEDEESDVDIPPQDFYQRTNDIYREEEEARKSQEKNDMRAAPSRRRSSYLRYENMADPVVKASLLSEMDELKQQLEDTKKLLQFANEERGKYSQEVIALKAEVETAKFQQELLQKDLSESRLREKYLELQLQQAMMQNEASSNQVIQSMKDMIRISNALQLGKPLPNPTPEVEECLLSMGIPLDEVNNDRKMNARRLAALSVGAIDPSGLLLKKWSLSGVSVVDRLSRLEEKLSKLNYG